MISERSQSAVASCNANEGENVPTSSVFVFCCFVRSIVMTFVIKFLPHRSFVLTWRHRTGQTRTTNFTMLHDAVRGQNKYLGTKATPMRGTKRVRVAIGRHHSFLSSVKRGRRKMAIDKISPVPKHSEVLLFSFRFSESEADKRRWSSIA